MKYGTLLSSIVLLVAASRAQAQRVESVAVSAPATVSVYALPAAPAEPRPPLPRGAPLMQVLSGGAGGIAGAFIAFVPLALAGFGGTEISETAWLTAAGIGYFSGTVLGVQAYGRALGMRGSWGATTAGALLGAIGGPAVFVTSPIGATIGYNRTRRLR